LSVAKTTNFKQKKTQSELLAACKYFTVKKIDVRGDITLSTDEKSFKCITCMDGNGFIDGVKIQKCDSFFVPENYGNFTLQGEM
jgi:mannose-6-phosphate isomerase class I